MLVVCTDCGRVYDDAKSSTLCPQHNPLDVPPRMNYCAKHDLFGDPCPACEPAPGRTDYYGVYMSDGFKETPTNAK